MLLLLSPLRRLKKSRCGPICLGPWRFGATAHAERTPPTWGAVLRSERWSENQHGDGEAMNMFKDGASVW